MVSTKAEKGYSYLYKLKSSNGNIEITKNFLGHRDIACTEIYVHIFDEDYRNVTNKNPLNDFELKKK